MNKSVFCKRDARTILEMEAVCFSCGQGPGLRFILEAIAAQHPELVAEFKYVDWPAKPATAEYKKKAVKS